MIDDSNRKDWVLRTREGYDLNIRHLFDDLLMAFAYGFKPKSCLNELQFFHVAEGLPPDLAHVFEEFSVDLISHVLVAQKKNSLQEFNNILSAFDKANKPQPLKIISGISFKLKETACEMWNLIRLLPLIIVDKIDEGNKVWGCLLKFVILVERLSPSFSKSDLVILNLILEGFF